MNDENKIAKVSQSFGRRYIGAFLLTATGCSGSAQAAESIVTIDINPSIELYLDKNQKVVDVKGKNDDGANLVNAADLKTKSVSEAIDHLVKNLLTSGYLHNDDGEQAILVSVQSDDEIKREAIKSGIKSEIYKTLQAADVNAIIYAQDFDDDDDLRKIADQYNISLGKAYLVNKIAIDYPELINDDVYGRKIGQLFEDFDDDDYAIERQVMTGNAQLITPEQAQALALAKLPGGTITDMELDRENGRLLYEGEISHNGQSYEFKFDATTGELLKWKLDDRDDQPVRVSNEKITIQNRDQIRAILANKAPGFVLDDLELERENGVLVYEGSLKQHGQEIDFLINAATGAIMVWEVDHDDDRYDDDQDDDKRPVAQTAPVYSDDDDYDDDDDDDDDDDN